MPGEKKENMHSVQLNLSLLWSSLLLLLLSLFLSSRSSGTLTYSPRIHLLTLRFGGKWNNFFKHIQRKQGPRYNIHCNNTPEFRKKVMQEMKIKEDVETKREREGE